ncbi:peroxidase [Botrimarina colliarenosi]|uniref:Peroxidase n=1 Tax=Botrimarina colliarenosi TaxID=2528001 RepID=A0A5C6A244_9BACT|nr:peroxidase family protein [Botrimarina colliarenosi]TWT93475.1 peroxidase [Botrimarina colliarenosi]
MTYSLRLLLLLAATGLPGLAALADYRAIDGTGNNLSNPTWGSAGAELLRTAPAAYPGDGTGSTMLGDADRGNPRTISNTLFAQSTPVASARGLSSGVWQWGQFLDHDITFTGTNSAESMMLYVPPADPYGMAMIPFTRSASHADGLGVRQQTNEITSWIDASMVYGSDATRATALRELSGGRMRTSGGGLQLPTNDMPGLGSLENDPGPLGTTDLFVAGDVRANEQTGLTSMHTLFVREHNRLAGQLAAANAGDASWDDERIYQTARRIVGAEVQAITYNEFLPALLGGLAPAANDYAYNSSIDATIATEFSTAFFRLGHSMLNEDLVLADDHGATVGSISLRDSFFNPQLIMDDPQTVDNALMGLMKQTANELDTKLIDGVRNFLFAPTGGMGTDLAALNIQRGRDHGLPDYNTLRGAFGLSPVASFGEITADAALAAQLESVYGGVDNIDPWVGALAEDHLYGASVGELLCAALVDQFSRLRDGDRYFYAGDDYLWSNDVASMIDFDTLTMTDVLAWNTAMAYEDMPPSFFMLLAVPEPTTIVMVGAALVGVARRRQRV